LKGIVFPNRAREMPQIDTTNPNFNAKQINKQLKQFYLQQKKAAATTGNQVGVQ
jgi:hypothetical protein